MRDSSLNRLAKAMQNKAFDTVLQVGASTKNHKMNA